jgi:hypothetical protein
MRPPWKTSRRRLRDEVRELALGGDRVPPGAWVRNRELLPAVVTYLRTGRRFRRDGLAAALQLVPPACGSRSAIEPGVATAFCARSAASRILGIARSLAGRHLCLHESVAITAALRRLGFSVQTIIGYPVIEPAGGEEELHAWPQLGEFTVVDRLGSAPLNFVELIRYPQEGPPARASAMRG